MRDEKENGGRRMRMKGDKGKGGRREGREKGRKGRRDVRWYVRG